MRGRGVARAQVDLVLVSVQYGLAGPIIFARNLEAFDLELGENNAVRSLEQQVRLGAGKRASND
jgi:hypothetical protein